MCACNCERTACHLNGNLNRLTGFSLNFKNIPRYGTLCRFSLCCGCCGCGCCGCSSCCRCCGRNSSCAGFRRSIVCNFDYCRDYLGSNLFLTRTVLCNIKSCKAVGVSTCADFSRVDCHFKENDFICGAEFRSRLCTVHCVAVPCTLCILPCLFVESIVCEIGVDFESIGFCSGLRNENSSRMVAHLLYENGNLELITCFFKLVECESISGSTLCCAVVHIYYEIIGCDKIGIGIYCRCYNGLLGSSCYWCCCLYGCVITCDCDDCRDNRRSNFLLSRTVLGNIKSLEVVGIFTGLYRINVNRNFKEKNFIFGAECRSRFCAVHCVAVPCTLCILPCFFVESVVCEVGIHGKSRRSFRKLSDKNCR